MESRGDGVVVEWTSFSAFDLMTANGKEVISAFISAETEQKSGLSQAHGRFSARLCSSVYPFCFWSEWPWENGDRIRIGIKMEENVYQNNE